MPWKYTIDKNFINLLLCPFSKFSHSLSLRASYATERNTVLLKNQNHQVYKHFQDPIKHLSWSIFAKIFNRYKPLITFAKKLYYRYLNIYVRKYLTNIFLLFPGPPSISYSPQTEELQELPPLPLDTATTLLVWIFFSILNCN